MLSDIDDFIRAYVDHVSGFENPNSAANMSFEVGEIYCPGCGAPRRIRLQLMSPLRTRYVFDIGDPRIPAIAPQLAPAVFSGTCLQDKTGFTLLLFHGPAGFELAVFPTVRGGLATPNTPPGVAYYLDQRRPRSPLSDGRPSGIPSR